jgi:hypothetical protein
MQIQFFLFLGFSIYAVQNRYMVYSYSTEVASKNQGGKLCEIADAFPPPSSAGMPIGHARPDEVDVDVDLRIPTTQVMQMDLLRTTNANRSFL